MSKFELIFKNQKLRKMTKESISTNRDDNRNIMRNTPLGKILAKEVEAKTSPWTDEAKEGEHGSGTDRQQRPYGCCRRCCTISSLILAAILFIIGLLTLRFTLVDIVMSERLRMTPGFPPYELWRHPQPEVLCKVYIFTVTNHERFLNRTDAKMNLQEIGPIIYRERLEHKDTMFHENSTMSYTVHRHLEFRPDLNDPDILNRTIIVPNIVLLGMAATLADYSFTFRIGFRLISKEDQVFVNTTIYKYMWNFTTPAFEKALSLVPFMIQQDNGGVVYNIYKESSDRVNVQIGQQHGYSEFFKINQFNGKSVPPGIPEDGQCLSTLRNSSEGALYPNYLKRNSTLWFWRKTVCRPVPIKYERDVWKGSLLTYKYVAHADMYDRLENSTMDCYRKCGVTDLPDGLSDISRCYQGAPVAISLPHFCGRSGYWDNYIEGLTPSWEKHHSYSLIEPKTGVPVEQAARSQSNLVMPKLSLFSDDIERFSGVVIPMVWMEYYQEKLTPFITAMLVFTVNVLPTLQYFISVLMIIGAATYLTVGINRLKLERRLRHIQRAQN